MSWFNKKREDVFYPPTTKMKYPKWTYVYTESTNKYWLILDSTKREFISERACLSWRMPVIDSTEEAITGYLHGGKVGFAPGTLVISQADQATYFITGKDPLKTERRRIVTPDFFTVLGFDMRNAFMVSLMEIDHHILGEDINSIT